MAIAFTVFVVWVFVGGLDYHGSGASANPSGQEPDKCEPCRRIQAWWDSLKWWRKASSLAWYLAQKAVCAAMGC